MPDLWSKNSPGRRRLVPYTSSAAVHLRSSLYAVRMPRRVNGSDSVQRLGSACDFRDAFSCQWKRSISPFAMG